MQILNLREGQFFQMGKGQNWRVIHPDMGAKKITLNHSIHSPGHEFPQHTHDESEDIFIILEGGVLVRQGHIYTPVFSGDAVFVPSYEIHGTVNTTDKNARLISFQSPPDMALYRGERNSSGNRTIKPLKGHVSAVQIITMSKGSPVFEDIANWRSIVSPKKGSKHLALDYIKIKQADSFVHKQSQNEEIYVLIVGMAILKYNGENKKLRSDDVLFVMPGDTFTLMQYGAGPTTIIHCWAFA
ncbi:MAG: cupin domain-containing protein [bacterium]